MKLEASPVGDGAGIVTVGCAKNSIIIDNKGEGKT